MKSIMHIKDGTCFLCSKLNKNVQAKYPLQEHHVVFGTAGRRLSEKYGLKVYLCLDHHLYGPDAVHRNKSVKDYLCKEAQKRFEEIYPTLSFIAIFGKNYLNEEDRQQDEDNRQQFGFIPIDDGVEGIEW